MEFLGGSRGRELCAAESARQVIWLRRRPRQGGARLSNAPQTSYLIKTVSSFLSLKFEFKCSCSGQREKKTSPHYFRRPLPASRTRHSSIMLLNANVDVFAKPNKKWAFGFRKT